MVTIVLEKLNDGKNISTAMEITTENNGKATEKNIASGNDDKKSSSTIELTAEKDCKVTT